LKIERLTQRGGVFRGTGVVGAGGKWRDIDPIRDIEMVIECAKRGSGRRSGQD